MDAQHKLYSLSQAPGPAYCASAPVAIGSAYELLLERLPAGGGKEMYREWLLSLLLIVALMTVFGLGAATITASQPPPDTWDVMWSFAGGVVAVCIDVLDSSFRRVRWNCDCVFA
jgi:hypothetical protein